MYFGRYPEPSSSQEVLKHCSRYDFTVQHSRTILIIFTGLGKKTTKNLNSTETGTAVRKEFFMQCSLHKIVTAASRKQ